jgi:hypothetical protein
VTPVDVRSVVADRSETVMLAFDVDPVEGLGADGVEEEEPPPQLTASAASNNPVASVR